MNKLSVLFLSGIFFLILNFRIEAATVRAIQSGDWSDSGIWQSGLMPSAGDSVIISAGKRVEVTSTLDYSSSPLPMRFNILGELVFQTGKKLYLPAGSYIVIQTGANITPGTGGGNSNLINIGGTIVWLASQGTLGGFIVLSGGVLPVEMMYFNAEYTKKQTVILNWETSAEVNNDYFNVERSLEGSAYKTVGRVKGHGTSSTGFKYYFEDMNPGKDIIYFRLKQVDFNGDFKYSQTVICRPQSKGKNILVYPNPSSDGTILVELNGYDTSVDVNVIIYNSKGEIIINRSIDAIPGSRKITVTQPGDELAKGMYHLVFVIEEEIFRQPVMVW
jgi:hypothetical protein